MSKTTKYLLVSLPTSISPSNERDEALTALRSSVSPDYGITYPFNIPTFKIGALDALIQQADDLAKLSSDCEAVVGKIADSLASILEGDSEKITQQKNVNDKPVDQYLQTFSWNKVKYRADKPIAELADSLRKELLGLDNDVRSKFGQYNGTKNSLLAAHRKQTGNLSTKSLISIVDPSSLVTSSEYIETHLLAIPRPSTKDYLKSYESLSPMVIPRSSTEIAADKEFTLFAVSTFKKHSAEFLHKCRERKWTPRDFRYAEGSREEEQAEVERLSKEERKLWGEALRLGRTGFSEAAMTWMHVLALRVFVETILRYGLPAEFVCGLIKTNEKVSKKIKGTLDATYMHLAGNAVGRDSKGRVVKDDSSMQTEMQSAGQSDGEYTPYVLYEFEMS
ncbi:MAG: Vacuolar ATP synthase subunit C [Chrysothrix sp. TS-e1954]|nr:MAG: Vacuolar ATP synthase subunit C [Chrysothrix sp. TS-e1954]